MHICYHIGVQYDEPERKRVTHPPPFNDTRAMVIVSLFVSSLMKQNQENKKKIIKPFNTGWHWE